MNQQMAVWVSLLTFKADRGQLSLWIPNRLIIPADKIIISINRLSHWLTKTLLVQYNLSDSQTSTLSNLWGKILIEEFRNSSLIFKESQVLLEKAQLNQPLNPEPRPLRLQSEDLETSGNCNRSGFFHPNQPRLLSVAPKMATNYRHLILMILCLWKSLLTTSTKIMRSSMAVLET